jgi:hypothetical protein
MEGQRNERSPARAEGRAGTRFSSADLQEHTARRPRRRGGAFSTTTTIMTSAPRTHPGEREGYQPHRLRRLVGTCGAGRQSGIMPGAQHRRRAARRKRLAARRKGAIGGGIAPAKRTSSSVGMIRSRIFALRKASRHSRRTTASIGPARCPFRGPASDPEGSSTPAARHRQK